MAEAASCVAGVTRKEYVATVVERATAVGFLAAPPALVDVYLRSHTIACDGLPGPLADGQQPMGSTTW